MWLLYALLAFAFWGSADLFYKIGNKQEGKYNHLKTGIFVGLVMGIHAFIYLIINRVDVNIVDVLKYLPISFCYISSMVIGYKGLKYLELSISSPVQNTSGVITALLLLLFFKETLAIPAKEKVIILTIIFPLAYCLLDGLGTFLDAIYLDKLELISEDAALVAYELTFAFYALVSLFYLKQKKETIHIGKEKSKLFAAILETAGQFFYVFAMAGNSVIVAPIVGSYCILSMLLSRIVLKEKLTKQEYFGIFLVVIGIVILSILDI